MSRVRVCQLILRIRHKHFWWNLSSHFRCQQYVVQVSEEYRSAMRTRDLYTLTLTFFFFSLQRNTILSSNFPKATDTFWIHGCISAARDPSLDKVLPSCTKVSNLDTYSLVLFTCMFGSMYGSHGAGVNIRFCLFQTYWQCKQPRNDPLSCISSSLWARRSESLVYSSS